MILKAQMHTVRDKTVISSPRWYAFDQYGLLIMVGGDGGVGGDFSQTGCRDMRFASISCQHSRF